MAARSQNVGGSNPEFVLRNFQGMNLIAGREAMNDDEFYWCENAIPVSPGAIYPVRGPSAALTTVGAETGPPSYVNDFNTGGVDYCFAVWSNSGHGYIVNLSTFVATQIITGLFSGQTAAVQYGNSGLLIVDPTGYWDWNITAANTLTVLNNTLMSPTLVFSNNIPGGTNLKNGGVVPAGPGAGAVVQTTWKLFSAVVLAAGAGYVVGDALILTNGSPTTVAQLTVTGTGGGGAITTVAIVNAGSYPGPPPGNVLTAIGPTGLVVSGGTGAGATFTVLITTLGINILNPGANYSHGGVLPNYGDLIVTNVLQNQFTFLASGVISATAIATYAGRVWLANGRVVLFTDINSYNSFGGAGGTFTINDSYLHNAITALFSANNYLYIFGDTSIDALSNVTISNGVTAFSRINVTTSVGTSNPTSVFGYFRAVVFYHTSGFYLLSGATTEKISEAISELVNNIVGAVAIYGGQVIFKGELCALMQFTFTDVFTQNGTVRTLYALYFRKRWYVASLPGLPVAATFTVPNQGAGGNPGTWTAYSWSGTSMYRVFDPAATLAAWLIKTKLYDGGAAVHEHQNLSAAIGAYWAGAAPSGVTFTVDTELASAAAIPVQVNGSPTAYQFAVAAAPMGGGQYVGLSIAGGANTTKINLVALRAQAGRDMMQ